MRCRQPVTTMVVAVCLLVAGCVSEWDRGMQALKADPMASASWEGLELLATHETSSDGYKPPGPNITYCYKIAIPVEEVIEVVLATAEEYGWVEDPAVKRKRGTVARKEIAGSRGG